MAWQVEYTDEFERWWVSLNESEQVSIAASVLLICGDKKGNDRWYVVNVSHADRLYDEHLVQLKREGLLHG
jgi:hypothetical protein